MKILRQSQFSNIKKKIIYGIEKLVEPINRTSFNLSNKLYRTIIPTNSKKARELDFYISYPKKKLTKPELIKKSIDLRNKINRSVNNSINNIKNVYYNTGDTVNSSIETLAKNPISTITQVAGKATIITDPTGVGAVPIGVIGTTLEQGLKKSVPVYKKLTTTVGEKYKKSKLSREIKEKVPNGPKILKGAEQLGRSVGL